MKIFAVKFEYDNGIAKDNQICLVVAENESQAREKFEGNIYTIFNNHDDVCKLVDVKEVQDPDIIFLQRGFMWATINEGKSKILW